MAFAVIIAMASAPACYFVGENFARRHPDIFKSADELPSWAVGCISALIPPLASILGLIMIFETSKGENE